ncbi:MAG: response regulator transcription factor, partial [Actinobacteria bacterium]|nr:response regulator transcription factor [Actinomycetota bacterium]
DLVIMDSRVREGGGVQATLSIRELLPDTRVLMLSSFPEDDTLYAAIVAGASGFLLKHVKADELVRAVRGIFEGQSLMDPAVTTAVLRRIREGGPARDEKLARLSEREEDILGHIARGETNAEIARTLHYSERAVKKAVTRILAKLEVRRRSEAAAYYASHTQPKPRST